MLDWGTKHKFLLGYAQLWMASLSIWLIPSISVDNPELYTAIYMLVCWWFIHDIRFTNPTNNVFFFANKLPFKPPCYTCNFVYFLGFLILKAQNSAWLFIHYWGKKSIRILAWREAARVTYSVSQSQRWSFWLCFFLWQQPSTLSYARHIIKKEGLGLRGLNKGFTATLGRHGVFNMVYFGFYYNVKNIVPVNKVII